MRLILFVTSLIQYGGPGPLECISRQEEDGGWSGRVCGGEAWGGSMRKRALLRGGGQRHRVISYHIASQ